MTSKDNLANLSPAEKRKLLAELLAKSGGNAPRIFPLASGQKALWLLHQQDPSSAAYNTPFALRLRSEIDPAALRRSFQQLAARHPSLRTTFSATADGQLLQTVHPTLEPHFGEHSAKDWSPEQLHEEVVRAYRRPFSLEKGPLFRGDLFTVGPADHVLLITIHHIVYDAWSAQILQRELSQIYLALSKGGTASLAPVRGNYQDFVAKQAELVAGPVGRAHLDYWQKKLSGELPLLALPADRSRSARAESRAGAATFRLDPALTMGIKALAHSEQATPFAVLLAAYAALLGRLSGQDDVLVGSPTTGRPGVEAHDVVGYYANPVVLRADLSGAPSGRALIGRLRTVVLDALAHQDFPFASLVERLEHARRPGVSPIFQASISLQSSQEGAEAMELWATPEEGARIRWGHVELEPYPLKDQEGQFDLTLEMWEARGTFAGVFRFNQDLFDESTVKLWRGYFEQLIAAMVRTPDTEIARLPLMAPAKPAPSTTAAAAVRARPVETINAMFARQVAQRPEAIALGFGDSRLSYAELDHRANVLAHELAQRGVGPESLVGVCVDRSLELVVAILAVVKAGGAYVPLDPASPKDRLGMILEDADVQVLITETKRAAELPTGKVSTIFVDAVRWSEGRRGPGPAITLNPDNAAYVIYTSGSTGKPKGVIVTHANVTRLFTTTEGLYDFGAADVWTLFHSAAFDFSVWELWGALLYGGRLLVIPHWMSRSPEAFAELIDREGVTVLNQTPSAFRQLLRAPNMAGPEGGKSLRWVIFGGEALDAATVRPWFERHPGGHTRLVNMYGITETTVHVTYHLVSPTELGSSQSLIGEPIPDLRILLLDAHGAPVPVGVPGEIYVGGEGVARGYLKRPELTAQRFLPDPEHPGKKLYRSGDLAIRLPDGGYNYLGRMDHQVKIRGFRIELGEIQSVIAEHPAVAEAFVMTFDKSEDDRRLVAYVVPKAGAAETLLSSEADSGIKDTHVNEWQELYDELYARSATDQSTDLGFNIAGWNSSYSGAPLSAEAMKEWVDRTVAQVLERKPARVLEIGSGSGLLLTRIAPHTKAYVGTDVSEVVVELVSGYAKRTPGLEHAKLYACPADELDRLNLGAERFDAVIINSVVQYFPSGEYLAKVLENAVARVAPGGFVFVGDVRNLRLLEAFHASILLAQSTGAIDPAVMKERVARRIAAEEELVLDPDFFWGLRERAPRISHVEVRPKRGACQNELTRFRYDVVLHVESPPAAAPEVSWGPGSVGLLELRERLSQAAAPRVGLRGIRNARVQAALEATSWLTEVAATDRGSAEKLRRRVIDRDSGSAPIDAEPGVDPEALHRLAEALNLEVALDWSRGGQDGSYDAVFGPRRAPEQTLTPVAWFGAAPELSSAKPRASDPLRGRLERRLETELRKRAQDRLPEYMVPASIMIVDRIPLTENGKVDRRALPAPATPQELGVAYVEPRTGEEEILCSVFAELLGAERVGVRDSFFDLGGHSLLATQVVSRIRSVFGVDLPLRALFENPTVEGLAAAVHGLHRQSSGVPLVELTQPLPRPAQVPLSSSQERMWILDRVEETRSPIYVIPLVLRLRGPLDERALRGALGTIVARHEALRTSFPTVAELPVQEISPDLALELPRAEPLELPAGLSEQEQLEALQRAVGLEVSRPFDLARGPVLRSRLFRVSELDHVLVLTMHHIVSDGWSIGVLARELSAAYGALKAGRAPVLPALPVQYADFALWQRQALETGALKASIEAYQQRLLGAPPFLELPADRPRPAAPTFQGGVVRFQLDRGLTTRLKDLSRREGATLYMTLLAAYSTYLARVSGQSDLVIGSPVANRNRAATEPLIGLFVNTLALRVNLAGDPSFLELLARVRKTTLDAYADQDVPFEKIVEAVSPERSLNRQPVVQAMFVLQNAPFSPPQLDGVSVEMLELDSITSKFDLTLSMQETPDGLAGLIEFSAEIFDRERIERMSRHLAVILENAVKEPKRRVQELGLIDAGEEKRIAAWSDGGPALEPKVSLLAQFEAQVKARPTAPAITCDGVALSYAALDQQAAALGRHLVSKGVGPEVLVAIALPRSVDLVVAILAIWKAGGAYLPIDPDYPEARVAHMLDDSRVKLVISRRSVPAAARWSQERVWLDEPVPAAEARLPGVVEPSQMAYVIYTSGSTGKPKGVVVEHRGLGNVARVQVERFGLGPDSAVLSFASPSFDASVWELAMALGSGARLVISTSEAARAGEGLAGLLRSQAVSHATLPPSTLAALPSDGDYPALRVLVSAGEACTSELVKRWSTPTRRFFNAYGPTETTICATMEECSPEARVSIGGPLPGFTVRILDQARRPVPIGVPGELCVGGVGLARAYLHRDELSRERFIEVAAEGGRLERLYTTGDLGRFGSDGRIEYLGRLDHQVKLRGYRIELGEIETILEAHPEAQQALAVVHKNQLVAYVVPRAGQKPAVASLLEAARKRLPDYMVPTQILLLDAFPLTPNGKIDRAKLPDPEQAQPKVVYAAPEAPLEQVLAEIWSEVLKKSPIGVHDNFFQLGGDSILGLQIIARATQRGLRLRPRQLFQHQTIAELAKVAGAESAIVAEQGLVEGTAPLTPIQRWFFEQDRADLQHYNMALLLEVSPSVDPTLLARALGVVERQHDALRLRFKKEGETWVQAHVAPSEAIRLVVRELPTAAELGPALSELHQSLGLDEGPVFAALLARLSDGTARLALVAHHLVVDGVSWGPILEDLLLAYAALARGEEPKLPAKTTSFKQWSEQLTAYAETPRAKTELDAWLSALDREGKTTLPLIEASASDTVGEASTIATWLSPDETKALLTEAPKALDVKVQEVLIAALARAVAGWCNQSSARIDVEGHGRELFEDLDLSRTVGWFTALYPLLVRVGAKESARETLARVKDGLRRIPNGGVGFGVLRYLSPDASVRARLAALPRAEVAFNYLGQLGQIPAHSVVLGAAKEGLGPLHAPRARRPHRLEINAVVTAEGLRVNWTFGAEVFTAEAIERLSASFISNLRGLLKDSAEPAAAAVRVGADFPAARVSNKDLQKLLNRTRTPRS